MTNNKCDICFSLSDEVGESYYSIDNKEHKFTVKFYICPDCFFNKTHEKIVKKALKEWIRRHNDKQ